MPVVSEPLRPPAFNDQAGQDASTERLLRELEARARAEADAVLSAAGQEVERIRGAAAAECASAREAAIASCERSSAGTHAARLAAARLEARRAVLAAQHAAVARVLEQVRQVASGMGGGSRAPDDVVAARVADVLSYLGGESSEIWCAPAIAPRVAALVRGGPVDVHVDTAILAGVRAATRDGRVTVDDTLDAWLAHEQQLLAIEICRELGRSDD